MTLDDLIEALAELKHRYPASGMASVVGVMGDITYDGGVVYIIEPSDSDEDDDDE